jgi:tetratricopeptide (TPR) repeat protein
MRASSLALCVAFSAAAGAAVACGGSNAPPNTGGTGSTSSATPTSTVATADTGSSVPEPPPSAEVDAGVKAADAGKFDDARKSFEAAVKKNPQNYIAYNNLGQVCEKLGDFPAAEDAFKHAVDLKPDLDKAAAELSVLYANDGKVDDALTVARNGLAKHPGSADLHVSMGVALAVKSLQDDAAKEFSAAVQSAPNDPSVHLTFAHYLNVWKVRGATPHLDAAVGLAGTDYDMLAEIGHEYRMAAAASPSPETELGSCVKTFDGLIKTKDGAMPRTERALCKLALKDEKACMDDLQAAVAKEPNYAPAHYWYAGRLGRANHFKEAAAEYAKYLDLAPNGDMAKAASEKLKMAQDAMKHPPKK